MHRFQNTYTKSGRVCRLLAAPKTLETVLLQGQWTLTEYSTLKEIRDRIKLLTPSSKA